MEEVQGNHSLNLDASVKFPILGMMNLSLTHSVEESVEFVPTHDQYKE